MSPGRIDSSLDHSAENVYHLAVNPALRKIHEELNIGSSHLSTYRLPLCEQPPLSELEVVEIDFEGRPFILAKSVSDAWMKMRRSANSDGVILEPFSGFRSYKYQKQLIERKLAKGRPLEDILTETAIPGFSEHHSGRAVDICTNGRFVLTEDFEKTAAYEWLLGNAARFQFKLSYPRANALGIVFEPWHWCFT